MPGDSNEPVSKGSRWRWVLAALFGFMCLGAGIKVLHKVGDDGTAFVRWMDDTARLMRGEMIYDAGNEGYPNLPAAAFLLTPFHALGRVAGSMAWLVFKCAAAAGILWVAADAARGKGRPLPEWQLVLLLLLSMRVFVGDLTHGNNNLVIGALIALALFCSCRQRDLAAGFSIGCAAVLKVTPLLFVPYFLYKRRWRALLGAAAGIAVLGWLVPGYWLGFQFSWELTEEWYRQMVRPFLSGAPVTYLQTGYINQSFAGLFFRLFCDTVAIAADAKRGTDELRINLAAWDQATVHLLVKAAGLCVLAVIAWAARTPREDRANLGNLGEFAMVFLAMLMLSERSWKHHYVLLVLPHAFLLRYLLCMRPRGWRARAPAALFAAALVCHYGFGAGTLGHYWSNVAEAWGVYLVGAILLFAACAAVLASLRAGEWPACPGAPAEPAAERASVRGR